MYTSTLHRIPLQTIGFHNIILQHYIGLILKAVELTTKTV